MNNKLILSVIGLPLLLVACGVPGSGTVKLKIWGPNQEQNLLTNRQYVRLFKSS